MSRSSKRRKLRRPPARTAVSYGGRPSRFASTPWWLSDWWLLDEQGHVGDITCDVGTIGDLAVTGASIRGYSHRLARGRCEDSFSIRAGRTSEDLEFLVAVIRRPSGRDSQFRDPDSRTNPVQRIKTGSHFRHARARRVATADQTVV